MIKRFVWLLLLGTGLVLYNCNGKAYSSSSDTIKINRFDLSFYDWIETDDTSALEILKVKYPQMTELLGNALFRRDMIDSLHYYDYLINFFTEPTIKTIYKDAVSFYSPDSLRTKLITEEFDNGFREIKKFFPSIQVPAIYFHVSGLQQNFILADSLLSCSIDKYLTNYPFYNLYFEDYQIKEMVADRMVKDALSAWIKSEFLFSGKSNQLLDRMIYEGKIVYAISKLNSDYTYRSIFSLTDEENKWLTENESAIWSTIIERKQLYTPDETTTSKYLSATPAFFLSDQAPGHIGSIIGYKIVKAYMAKTKSSFEELMKNNDAQAILSKSKYKP
jgi:hypothetical protein